MSETDNAECVVVGAGPAGLAAAAAIATTGANVCLIAPPPGSNAQGDGRTAALVPDSVEFLRNINAWDNIAGVSARLAGIRIVDDTEGLLRAPEVLFSATDIGTDTLGWNVPNAALAEALRAAIEKQGLVRVREGQACGLEIEHEHAHVALKGGGKVRARLVVAADGRNSICRQAAGIPASRWDYRQSAIATRFAHGRPHRGISTELHRRGGPLTTVPLPGLASSLVWVEPPAIAARLAGLGEAAFRSALEARLQGLLGTIGEIGPRQVYPLTGLAAERLGANRVALVGEAAHVLPPIGAQGLNLGLRDGAVLADVIAGVRGQGGDVGAPAALAAYHRARTGDVGRRTVAVDALNRSLTSNLLPLDLARGFGLFLVGAVPALRRALIRQGLEASGPRPRLMQPAVL